MQTECKRRLPTSRGRSDGKAGRENREVFPMAPRNTTLLVAMSAKTFCTACAASEMIAVSSTATDSTSERSRQGGPRSRNRSSASSMSHFLATSQLGDSGMTAVWLLHCILTRQPPRWPWRPLRGASRSRSCLAASSNPNSRIDLQLVGRRCSPTISCVSIYRAWHLTSDRATLIYLAEIASFTPPRKTPTPADSDEISSRQSGPRRSVLRTASRNINSTLEATNRCIPQPL